MIFFIVQIYMNRENIQEYYPYHTRKVGCIQKYLEDTSKYDFTYFRNIVSRYNITCFRQVEMSTNCVFQDKIGYGTVYNGHNVIKVDLKSMRKIEEYRNINVIRLLYVSGNYLVWINLMGSKKVYNMQTQQIVFDGDVYNGDIQLLHISGHILYGLEYTGREEPTYFFSYDLEQRRNIKRCESPISIWSVFFAVYKDTFMFIQRNENRYYLYEKESLQMIKAGWILKEEEGIHVPIRFKQKCILQDKLYVVIDCDIYLITGLHEETCQGKKVIHQDRRIERLKGKGNRLIVGDIDGTIRIYDTQEYVLLDCIPFVNDCLWAPPRKCFINYIYIIDEYEFMVLWNNYVIVKYKRRLLESRYKQIQSYINLPQDVLNIIINYVKETERMW